ncbi:MAG: hypothetical protein Q7U56_11920 [Humidesulfovibrio sp.]|nr:hypothetical protein [Desulfovibrio sp.]MDO9083976.1 hypothetical protein [Humidesulfovibrio sp.]
MCPSNPSPPHVRAARGALGFTLLEVIIIIIVTSLLAALVLNLMGTQLMRASTPATLASDAGEAEALMEAMVADYTTRVNGDVATALDTFVTAHPSNSTLTVANNNNWNNARVLTVTATVGSTSYTTLLTQARTNAADNATDF